MDAWFGPVPTEAFPALAEPAMEVAVLVFTFVKPVPMGVLIKDFIESKRYWGVCTATK